MVKLLARRDSLEPVATFHMKGHWDDDGMQLIVIGAEPHTPLDQAVETALAGLGCLDAPESRIADTASCNSVFRSRTAGRARRWRVQSIFQPSLIPSGSRGGKRGWRVRSAIAFCACQGHSSGQVNI